MINWHIYINETIEIKNNTVITGLNGCGKSTLIDAVAFLIGGSSKFNMAANDKSKRTLENYMRGKLGADSKLYLRNDDVITHIAIEFYDDVEKEYFVLGVCLELNNTLSKANRSYYILNKYNLSDSDYINNNKVSNYKDFENTIKSKKIDLRKIEGGINKVKTDISRILKFDEKYYELVPKSLAFKPIDEVNQFVYDFLMPEVLVDIEGMRENFRTYASLNAILQLEKQKQDVLKGLINDYHNYNKNQNIILLLEVLNIDNKINRLNNEIQKNISKINKLNIEINSLVDNDKILNDDLELTKNNVLALKNSDDYQLLNQIDNKIKIVENEIKLYSDSSNKFRNYLKSEIDLANEVSIKDYLSSYLNSKVDFISFKNNLSKYKLELEDKTEEINNEKYDLGNELNNLKKQIEEESKKIIELKSGKRSYSNSLLNLIEIIKETIKNKYGEEIKISPLCELIDLKEEEIEWRDALEGYLNTRKFDLFLEEKYYDDATEAYEKYKKKLNITGIGIVNTKALKERDIIDNSLACKVVSEHNNAIKYVNYLLGDLVCVENEKDLKRYEKSINKTVLVYQNKAVRQTNFKAFEVPHIGYNTIEIQLNIAKKQLEILSNNYKEITKTKEKIDLVSKIISNSNIKLIDSFDDVLSKYNNSKKRLNDLEIEKKNLIKTKDLVGVEEKINQLENDIISLNKKLENNKSDNIDKTSEIKTLNNKNIENNEEIVIKKNIVKTKLFSEVLIISFEKFKLNNNYNEDEYKSLTRKNEKLSYEVKKYMQSYIDKFRFDCKVGLEFINEFIEENNRVVSRNIISFENQCIDALTSCRHAFETVYIEKIRQSIRQEKENIKKINKILVDKKFGDNEEVYEFVITKSIDQVFAPYYDIFTSEESYIPSNLLENGLSSKNEDLMKELFDKLTIDDSTEKNEKILKQFLDYRNFMSYDIRITDKYEDISYFSKINKEKSGGETQTPFYVIIAAAFEQTTTNKTFKSSSCVVMLDEAFNNMDSSRIKSMMEFYDKLNIQLIILTPPERSATIIPYVDTAIGLVKKDNVVCVIPTQTVREVCLK